MGVYGDSRKIVQSGIKQYVKKSNTSCDYNTRHCPPKKKIKVHHYLISGNNNNIQQNNNINNHYNTSTATPAENHKKDNKTNESLGKDYENQSKIDFNNQLDRPSPNNEKSEQLLMPPMPPLYTNNSPSPQPFYAPSHYNNNYYTLKNNINQSDNNNANISYDASYSQITNNQDDVISFFPEQSVPPILPYYGPNFSPPIMPLCYDPNSSMMTIPNISSNSINSMDTRNQPTQLLRTTSNVSQKRHCSTLTDHNLFEFDAQTIQEPPQKQQKVSNHLNFGIPINFFSDTSNSNTNTRNTNNTSQQDDQSFHTTDYNTNNP
ncbi:MAG: hypothetical protein GY821_10375 [Gammaproteobacteria bacterium]|nr:hypothetical protein [Gammaproteobacteria bacterium]